MYFKRKISALILVAVLATACTDSNYRKLIRAGDDAAHATESGLDVTAQLYDQKTISPTEALTLSMGFTDAARIVRELKNTMARYGSLKDAGAVAAIQGGITQLRDSLKRLNEQGVLRLKSDAARQKFQLIMAAADTAIAIAEGLIPGVTK